MDNYNTYGSIYRITNTVNGKEYIGLTTRGIKRRFSEHCKADSFIGKAIRKHGVSSFRIEEIDTASNKKELSDKEKDWITKLGTFGKGYNLTSGGEGFDLTDRIEVVLTVRQKQYVEWSKRESKKGIDINDASQLFRAVAINLLQIYIIADNKRDKREAANQLNRMRNQIAEEIKAMNLIDLKEFVTYLS